MTVAVHANFSTFGVVGAAPKPIPAGLHGLDPFRGIAERHTWLAVKIGLLLKPTGIGQRAATTVEQRRHIQITDWVDDPQAGQIDAAARCSRARARMDW